MIAALRELRTNVRASIVAMEAALLALEPETPGRPELHYLVQALFVACGKRGASFGTACAIVAMLDNLLGEGRHAPEERS